MSTVPWISFKFKMKAIRSKCWCYLCSRITPSVKYKNVKRKEDQRHWRTKKKNTKTCFHYKNNGFKRQMYGFWLFICLELFPGWSWWRPGSLRCWHNVRSAWRCEIKEQGLENYNQNGRPERIHGEKWESKLTWPSRECILQDLWSSHPLPQFPHRLFLKSDKT